MPIGGRVGVDPYLISASAWKPLRSQLQRSGIKMVISYVARLISTKFQVSVSQNLVDLVWNNQPLQPIAAVKIQPLEYVGDSWQQKVKVLREKMLKKKAVVFLVSALDDVAWLLNLRGSDINFNPVFFAYVIVTTEEVRFGKLHISILSAN